MIMKTITIIYIHFDLDEQYAMHASTYIVHIWHTLNQQNIGVYWKFTAYSNILVEFFVRFPKE